MSEDWPEWARFLVITSRENTVVGKTYYRELPDVLSSIERGYVIGVHGFHIEVRRSGSAKAAGPSEPGSADH